MYNGCTRINFDKRLYQTTTSRRTEEKEEKEEEEVEI